MEEFTKKRKLELKNTSVKKYRLQSEILTRYFNEKNNEIDYQIHDYSYAKNIIIDHLNDDCLAEIFMYVPACERPKIALVCQKWKRALDYSWGNVKKFELTHWEYDGYQTCLKKYPILYGQFTFLRTLLYKCGRYLTKLDLTAYRHCNIVPVINECCPNLVELRLRFTFIDHVLLYNAFSRLSKLKVLAIIFQDINDKFIPPNLIYSLRNVADTLTDLVLLSWKKREVGYCIFPEETDCVIRESKVLKRVDISGIILSTDLQDYLYHEMSLFCSHDALFHSAETVPFENIKELRLDKFRISDDGLYTIANNLEQLTLLHMSWRNITNVGIATISKMKLKILSFVGPNITIDSSSIIFLKNLKTVRFTWNNKINDDSAIKVLENSPDLEKIFVLGTSVTVEFLKKAAEISSNRKIPLHIGVTLKCDIKQYESSYLTIEHFTDYSV